MQYQIIPGLVQSDSYYAIYCDGEYIDSVGTRREAMEYIALLKAEASRRVATGIEFAIADAALALLNQ